MLTTTSIHGLKFQVKDSTVTVPPGVARIGSGLLSYNGGQKTFDAMLAPGGDASRYYNSILYLAPVDATNFNSVLNMTSIRSTAAVSASSLSNPALPTLSYPIGLFTIYTADGSHFTSYTATEPAGSSGGTQGLTGVQGIQGATGVQPTGDITGSSLSVSGGITGASLFVGSGDISGGNVYLNNITGSSLYVTNGIGGSFLNLAGNIVSFGNISANNIQGTDIQGASLSVTNGITGASLFVGSGDISGGGITGDYLNISGNISSNTLGVADEIDAGGNILGGGTIQGDSVIGNNITSYGDVAAGGSISGTFISGGTVSSTGDIISNTDASIVRNLWVGNDASIVGRINAVGSISSYNNVSAVGTLSTLNGNIQTTNGNIISNNGFLEAPILYVDQDATVTNNLEIGNDATVFGNITSDGFIYSNSSIGTAGTLSTLNGNIQTTNGNIISNSGFLEAPILYVDQDATVTNNLEIGNDAIVDNNLEVSGNATVTNTILCNSIVTDPGAGLDSTLFGTNLTFRNQAYVSVGSYMTFYKGSSSIGSFNQNGFFFNDATVYKNLILSNIPTSNPGVPGAVYRDGSNLCISI